MKIIVSHALLEHIKREKVKQRARSVRQAPPPMVNGQTASKTALVRDNIEKNGSLGLPHRRGS